MFRYSYVLPLLTTFVQLTIEIEAGATVLFVTVRPSTLRMSIDPSFVDLLPLTMMF
jgi:hypothetical protein